MGDVDGAGHPKDRASCHHTQGAWPLHVADKVRGDSKKWVFLVVEPLRSGLWGRGTPTRP